jgi:LmeA-like phospholipid-binding
MDADVDASLTNQPDQAQSDQTQPDPTEPVEEAIHTGGMPPTQSRLIGKVLTPAVKLWLRSQTDHIEDLQVQIRAGDRQILSGHIPEVTLSARKAIYRGLQLSQIQLVGQNISINLGQVLRGHPLRLEAAIPIRGKLLMQEVDLNASLNAPLLLGGVTEFLLTLLRSGSSDLTDLTPADDPRLNLQNIRIVLGINAVTLSAALIPATGKATDVTIRTGFHLTSPQQLSLVDPQWLPHATAKRGLPLNDLQGFTFDLGPDTQIHQLRLEPGQVVCQGQLLVKP